jgi:hypothetical protein
MNKKTLKSMGSVLAGTLAGIVLSIGTDMALRAAGVLPTFGESAGDIPLLLATVYRTVYGVAGAYLTARLAPNRPIMHALVLGVLGLAASIAGAVVTWNKGPAFGPHWYPLALIVLAIPQSWVGGRLREIQLHAHGSLV